jgi:hypothetical protein
MRAVAVLVVVLASRDARADFANNELLHAHADAVIAASDPGSLAPARRAALHVDRLTMSLGALVPVFGTSRLDGAVFGGVRPSAIVFDWVLGGAVPVGLAALALADTGLSSSARDDLAWTALGLYAVTRVGILVIGNLHVSEWNRYIDVKLAAGGATAGVSLAW